MKSRNYTFSVEDAKEGHRMVDEYRFIGREASYDASNKSVTLYGMPTEYKKKRERDARVNAKRERETESYDQYN